MQGIYPKLFFIFTAAVRFMRKIDANYYYILQVMSLWIEIIGYWSVIFFSDVAQMFNETIFKLMASFTNILFVASLTRYHTYSINKITILKSWKLVVIIPLMLHIYITYILVCVISCKWCNKQYVSETYRKLKYRFTLHLSKGFCS